MAKKKTKKKKHTKKSRAIVAALRHRKPTGAAKKPRKRRRKKAAKKKRAKKVVKKTTVKGKRPRKGSKRKPFSTKVQIGRTKARIVAPPNTTLDVHSTARKRRDGAKVTTMVARVHRGRIVRHPELRKA